MEFITGVLVGATIVFLLWYKRMDVYIKEYENLKNEILNRERRNI